MGKGLMSYISRTITHHPSDLGVDIPTLAKSAQFQINNIHKSDCLHVPKGIPHTISRHQLMKRQRQLLGCGEHIPKS